MKKISLILAIVMVLSLSFMLASCGSEPTTVETDPTEDVTTAPKDEVTTPTTTKAPDTTTAPAEPVDISGFVASWKATADEETITIAAADIDAATAKEDAAGIITANATVDGIAVSLSLSADGATLTVTTDKAPITYTKA
jgi:PBP1b-binding outer membrane lipoprotein LpoB